MANCRFKLVMAHLCRCVSLPARQRQPACRRRVQLDLSCRLGAEGGDGLQGLWEGGERVLCGGWRLDADGNRTAVLAMLPAAEHPPPASLDRLAHEYGLKDELDDRGAVGPLGAVPRQR